MAPALNHPPAVSFIDDAQKAVHSEAAEYYGQEQFSRGRTYSAVSVTQVKEQQTILTNSIVL